VLGLEVGDRHLASGSGKTLGQQLATFRRRRLGFRELAL